MMPLDVHVACRYVLASEPPHPIERVVNAAIRSVAEQESITLVDCDAAFRKLLETRPWRELFVSDGHCNDAGYDVMATLVESQLGRPSGADAAAR